MSRHIDALIAENVFGWVSRWHADVQLRTWGRPDYPGTVFAERDLPHYSTDIAAAWQVVEKMMSEGFGYQVSGAATESACFRKLRDDIEVYVSNNTDFGGNGESVPMLICLAALKAKGVEPSPLS